MARGRKKGQLWYPKDVNKINPDFAVGKGYITGKMSNETKKNILNTYGREVRERLLSNKGYSIVFENNGSKFREIYNLVVKRVDRSINRNYKPKEFSKPILKLRLEVSSSSKLKVVGETLRKVDCLAIPINERYKFPKG